jgi:hypothetical protein
MTIRTRAFKQNCLTHRIVSRVPFRIKQSLKALSVLIISGHGCLKKCSTHISSGTDNIFPTQETFFKSSFSLAVQIGVAFGIFLPSYGLLCLNRMDWQLSLEMSCGSSTWPPISDGTRSSWRAISSGES